MLFVNKILIRNSVSLRNHNFEGVHEFTDNTKQTWKKNSIRHFDFSKYKAKIILYYAPLSSNSLAI